MSQTWHPMFRLLQAIVLSVAFIGWVIYQMVFKKRSLASLQGDIMAILFFMAVWLGIYYFAIR